MKYKVLVELAPRNEFDDTLIGEYDGVEYETKEKAEEKKTEAMKEYPAVWDAWIEEV